MVLLRMSILIRTLLIILLFNSFAFAEDSISKAIDRGISKTLTIIGKAITDAVPGEGDTEITISEQENYDIKYSILVVRPIAMNPLSVIDNKHLYFTQVRFGNHEPFANNDERHLLNLGFGLRSLTNNNNAIVGANVFYDYEFDEGHSRASVGVEYLASNFQLSANIYDRLSESESYTSGSTTLIEEVLNGHDYSIVGQVPYLPWANLIYNGYRWDQSGPDLEGNRISLEAKILRGMVFEYGRNDIDNASDDEHFYNLTLRWPNDHRGLPTIFTNPVSDYAFSEKNMENEMLHKVRRTNNIITQRSGGGAVVARGT